MTEDQVVELLRPLDVQRAHVVLRAGGFAIGWTTHDGTPNGNVVRVDPRHQVRVLADYFADADAVAERMATGLRV